MKTARFTESQMVQALKEYEGANCANALSVSGVTARNSNPGLLISELRSILLLFGQH